MEHILRQSSRSFTSLQNWDVLRYFVAVAKAESIGGAAKLLKESPPTVSRRIREFERMLCTRLFERAPTGVALTEAGRRLLVSARNVEAEIEAINERIQAADTDLAGRVSVTAPNGLGRALLVPRLQSFKIAYPQIDLELFFAIEKLSLRNRDADVAIRVGDPKDPCLVGKRIGQVRFSLYAHEKYLEQHGTPISVDDLKAHLLIDASAALSTVPQMSQVRAMAPDCRRLLATNNLETYEQVIRDGFGFGPLPRYLAAAEPGLVELLPGQFDCAMDIWVLTHPELKSIPRVRLALDFLSDIAREATSA